MEIDKTQYEFSMPAMKRILIREGAERVSDEAATQLLKTLNHLAIEIAHNAIKYAHIAGKKTITAENVREATTWILKGGREVIEDG